MEIWLGLVFLLFPVAILFQLGLVLGAPWGEWAMAGKFPGKLPLKMRITSFFQMLLLLLMGIILVSRAGFAFPAFAEFSRPASWFIVAFFVLGSFLNIITPSKKERMIWAPVNLLLLVSSVAIALS